jgi:hypothetical protein
MLAMKKMAMPLRMAAPTATIAISHDAPRKKRYFYICLYVFESD